MTARMTEPFTVSRFLHDHLLKLVILSYMAAVLVPATGNWFRDVKLVNITTSGGRLTVTPPTLLLAFLLFAAGLRVRFDRVGRTIRRPGVLIAGLAANWAIPTAFLLALMPTLGAWHNAEEAAAVLIGLALVASMPIAGSSTGWSQAADGDMALSLGLVVGSTLLSPIATPVALLAVGSLAPEPLGGHLRQLAGIGAGGFLATWVLVPSLLGMAMRAALTAGRATDIERRLKPIAPLILPMLCYTNASACLPQALRNPDWDFLGITLVLASALCAVTFTAGYVLGRLLRVDLGRRTALVFGLGMNNNGTGLVFASLALASQPMVLLPLIAYNLVQHVAAGCANSILRRDGAA